MLVEAQATEDLSPLRKNKLRPSFPLIPETVAVTGARLPGPTFAAVAGPHSASISKMRRSALVVLKRKFACRLPKQLLTARYVPQ